MRREGAGLIFGVELGTDKEGMEFLIKFDGFDQFAVGGSAGDDQPKFFEAGAIAIVKFVAVAMPFLD